MDVRRSPNATPAASSLSLEGASLPRSVTDQIQKILTMLDSGIGMEDQGLTYLELAKLGRSMNEKLANGQMTVQQVRLVNDAVQKLLVTQGLARFEEYMTTKASRANLSTIVDAAADSQSSSQISTRVRARQVAVEEIRTTTSPQELADALATVNQRDSVGTLDPITAQVLRHAIELRLGELESLAPASAPRVPGWLSAIVSDGQRHTLCCQKTRA